MEKELDKKAHRILFLNTLAFTICFAAWTFNGVMVAFLTENNIFQWNAIEIGWLLGIPILTGAIFRLPVGILTDKFGGKWIFVGLLLLCALPLYLISYAESYAAFALLSACFGLAGTGFAVGIAYTSVWYPKNWQGRALGIFGAGNAGAAITTLFAPSLLNYFTEGGTILEKWRQLPQVYALVLVLMALLLALFAINKKPNTPPRTLGLMLQPLKNIQVWRFGLYYFLVFGCFVAFAQWLVPYYMNVYGTSLVAAGMFASLFSLPSGVIRVLGGWMSDRIGPRKVMFKVFKWSIVLSILLMVPKMDVITPGKGVIANKSGIVQNIEGTEIVIGEQSYSYQSKRKTAEEEKEDSFLPYKESWQEPVVAKGDSVKKKELIAKGYTMISFQANVWVYTLFVLAIGIVWGIGKAGVYRFIPDYFPEQVGVVGGMVGVIGGLGGFFCPIIFGYLLDWTGLWTSSWMLMLVISTACYYWISIVVRKIIAKHSPEVSQQIEYKAAK